MKSLLAIGECMMELIPEGDELFRKSYAGDTYNTSVYAKRFLPALNVSFFSAVGCDDVSEGMLAKWQQEGINTTHCLKTADYTVGIYSIATDAKGERSFSYWRKNSAATHMMNIKPIDELVRLCSGFDYVFFSGISLGILSENDKDLFLLFIAKLKKAGGVIAFDPNYRPAMWNDKAHAIHWLTAAYRLSDIVLPGMEDHEQLFGHKTYQQIADFCDDMGITEVVIKCGDEGTFGFNHNVQVAHQVFKPAAVQIDSTAAGDSFAGTYLAARLNNHSIKESITHASYIAGKVVQYKGAIVSKKIYQTEFIHNN
ncbi:sugar kinase [Thalassotalea piscium]